MNAKTIISSFLLFFPVALHAQNMKVKTATLQRWSGGVAGMSGGNYTFVIECSGYKKEPAPDTLWIGQEAVPLIISHNASQLMQNENTQIIRVKNKVKIEINARITHNEEANQFPNPGNKPAEKPGRPPIAYNGVALLSYLYKGKEHYFEIGKIMKFLPPVNYP